MQKLRSIVTVALVATYIGFAQSESSPPTGIEGVVTVAPIWPGPIRRGDERPNSAPFANITLVAKSDSGAKKSFTTNDVGRFRVSLDPGHYVVALENGGITRCGPFDVDVRAGMMTQVNWGCDSGMR
jgi:hypothetical protein